MSVQYITDETGKPTAVIIPIREWETVLRKLYEKEAERDDTAYLLESETMRERLIESKNRSRGKSWEEVKDALGI